MNKIRHFIGSLVIFAVLTSLILTIYNDFSNIYGFTDNSKIDDKNIMESINDLNIISGMNNTITAFQDLTEPKTGSTGFDISGALLTGGIGFLQVLFSFITTPFEILNIIGLFYGLPPILIMGVDALIIIYFMFIIASSYLRNEI